MGLGNAAGGAVLGYQQDQQDQLQSQLNRRYLEAQIGEMQRRTANPQDAEGFGQPEMVMGPDGKPMLVQFGNRGTSRAVEGYKPNPLQQYGRVNPGDFTPESLQKYTQTGNFSDLVRVFAPQIESIGGVPTMTPRQVGGVAAAPSPLSNLGREADAKATLAGAEAGAKSTATATAERAASIQKKGADATSTLTTLDMADSLIDLATGSAGGAAVNKVASWLGYAPDGAQAIASLKVLQANLMTSMPRMEGPQSDKDVQLYREAAGQIGDPAIPAAIKKAAVKTIREINKRYQERAGIGGESRPQNSGPAIGSVEGGYRFKGGDPANPNSWERAQ